MIASENTDEMVKDLQMAAVPRTEHKSPMPALMLARSTMMNEQLDQLERDG